jgi:FkbM family methyltransferase
MRSLYNLLVLFFGRPGFQFLFEKLFRILIGFMGYMNWSSDFKMTGEKRLLEKLERNFELNLLLDVGANRGQWANLALQFTSADVISFEPQKETYALLLNLQEQFKNRLQTFNLAIGDIRRNILIYNHNSSTELSFTDNRLTKMPLLVNKSSKGDLVKMETLDYLYEQNSNIFKNLDFIKIDVEGSELKVLLGARNLIKQTRPRFIQIEVNWHHLFTNSSLYQFSLLLPNYKCFKILPSGTILKEIDPKYPLNNLYQLSNFLFARSDIAKSLSKFK